MRKLTGYAGVVVGVVGIVMSLYHVYARLTPAAPDSLVLRYHRAGLLPGPGLPPLPAAVARRSTRRARASRPARRPPDDPVDRPGAGGAVASTVAYFFVYYGYVTDALPDRAPAPPRGPRRWARCACSWCWRRPGGRSGWRCRCSRLCFVAYGLAGPWLPGPLRHKGLTYEILIDQTFFTTEGLFGIPLGVAASYVILFIIFGAFLEKSGAGQFFMSFANAIAGG